MLYLRDKIKKIVTKEDDLNKVMDYIYWEVTKLLDTTPIKTLNKVKKFLRNKI